MLLHASNMSPAAHNDNLDIYSPSVVGKGKAKAKASDVTERTPLLSSATTAGIHDIDSQPNPAPIHSQPRLLRRIFFVFTITLATCIILFTFLVLIAYGYSSRVSNVSTDDILEHGLVVKGPDRLDVLNTTEAEGMWVRIEGRAGVDAGALIDVKSARGDPIWRSWWKALGRFGVNHLGSVSVDLSTIRVTPRTDPVTVLGVLQTSPIPLTLTADPPPDLSWLTPVSLTVLISPTKDSSVLTHFAQDCWTSGAVDVAATVASVTVRGGGLFDNSWRNMLRLKRRNIESVLNVKIPPFPGLPAPGRDTPFPSFINLVTLKAFHLFSDLNKLMIEASVTFIDPAPESIQFTAPPIPFVVSIPSTNNSSTQGLIPIASFETQPFRLSHPNLTVDITGHVLPLASDASSAISSMLSAYLSAHSPNISIHSPLLPGFAFDTVFPAPNPKPRILRGVTIKNMVVKPTSDGGMSASGTVFAYGVLPRGMNLALDISRVFPELLVYDGPVPENVTIYDEDDGRTGDDEHALPPPMTIPNPLPERAFAHVRPGKWLDALSVPVEPPEGEGGTVAVSAVLKDVPLQVLPGREEEFSNFVTKVIFGSHGALAGVSGVASVAARVEGLAIGDRNKEMEVHNLPFRGDLRIGKNAGKVV